MTCLNYTVQNEKNRDLNPDTPATGFLTILRDQFTLYQCSNERMGAPHHSTHTPSTPDVPQVLARDHKFLPKEEIRERAPLPTPSAQVP